MRILLVEDEYNWSAEVERNAIEVYIHRLRRKIPPQLIRTVRGLGYQMVTE